MYDKKQRQNKEQSCSPLVYQSDKIVCHLYKSNIETIHGLKMPVQKSLDGKIQVPRPNAEVTVHRRLLMHLVFLWNTL